ncbi:MAG: hypothetical protein GY797_28290 [Deltaproteobacteria bacterium]|nr:hypothetical protein [Deltaproteobacteria bacterium]
MHHSETATYGGNHDYYYGRCKKCGFEKFDCVCWMDFMDLIERWLEWKAILESYKILCKNSIWIRVIDFIRRTPTSISGMRGLKLLERIDKR